MFQIINTNQCKIIIYWTPGIFEIKHVDKISMAWQVLGLNYLMRSKSINFSVKFFMNYNSRFIQHLSLYMHIKLLFYISFSLQIKIDFIHNQWNNWPSVLHDKFSNGRFQTNFNIFHLLCFLRWQFWCHLELPFDISWYFNRFWRSNFFDTRAIKRTDNL